MASSKAAWWVKMLVVQRGDKKVVAKVDEWDSIMAVEMDVMTVAYLVEAMDTLMDDLMDGMRVFEMVSQTADQ